MKKLLTLLFLTSLFYSYARGGCNWNFSIKMYQNGFDSLICSGGGLTFQCPVPDTIFIYQGDSLTFNYCATTPCGAFAALTFNGTQLASAYDPCDQDHPEVFGRTASDTGYYVFSHMGTPIQFQLSYYQNTGIENINANDFKIYPNPAASNLTLQFSEAVKGNIGYHIYDVVGREVATQSEIKNPQSAIDISSLHAGVYFLKINEGENAVVKRFLKE